MFIIHVGKYAIRGSYGISFLKQKIKHFWSKHHHPSPLATSARKVSGGFCSFLQKCLKWFQLPSRCEPPHQQGPDGSDLFGYKSGTPKTILYGTKTSNIILNFIFLIKSPLFPLVSRKTSPHITSKFSGEKEREIHFLKFEKKNVS